VGGLFFLPLLKEPVADAGEGVGHAPCTFMRFDGLGGMKFIEGLKV
jgi:hypothetical protein